MLTQSPARRLAPYARVSTDNQEKQDTIASQINALQQWTEWNGGHVVDYIIDSGYSGATLRRPGLSRLRADAKAGRLDCVVAVDLGRISRGKPWMRGLLEDELRGYGVTVHYLNRRMEDSAEGRVMDGLASIFAQSEREKIAERTQRGKRDKLEQGHIWRSENGHNRPYGWRYVRPTIPHRPASAPSKRSVAP